MDFKFEPGRFYSESDSGEILAEVTYALDENKKANIDHTFVNPKLRGKGVGQELMKKVTDYFRQEKIKTTAQCSYANMWLKRNRDKYADIISDDFVSGGTSCKIN